jgi:hypothetical protein
MVKKLVAIFKILTSIYEHINWLINERITFANKHAETAVSNKFERSKHWWVGLS